MKRNLSVTLLFLFFLTLHPSSLFALGKYGEGWAVVRLIKFESGGILYKSYEGKIQLATYNESENCNDTDNKCYTPLLETLDCSVSPDNKQTVYFMNLNLGRQMLVHYRIHRIKPISLGSNMEILEARVEQETPPASFPSFKVVKQTGSKRNFSIYGKILKIENRGTMVKTYEGLYYDKTRDRVHPFSVTDEEMAQYIQTAMNYTKEYYIGLSVARVKGVRESFYDIFEINYKNRAGGIQPP